jgi:hypothetical protein
MEFGQLGLRLKMVGRTPASVTAEVSAVKVLLPE